ncbi:MAG: uroporphyrinogen decarboxylase family protein [Actinobacteria bacterium]|nr:uroporphyrinogen decarboxylase family protein [Actinomycetota bacterium]
MTGKERFNTTLQFKEPDRPPHFEHIFELEEEAFGLSFPTDEELNDSTGISRLKLFERCSEIYTKIAEKFEWDAIIVWKPNIIYTDIIQSTYIYNPARYEFIPFLKKYLGDDIPVGGFIFGAVICIDSIKDYMQFAVDLLEDRGKLHKLAKEMYDNSLEHAKKLIDCGSDFISINSDFAFNSGSFLSPNDFAEFVTPHLKELVGYIKKQGIHVILHSDGNLMTILDQIIDIAPHVLHSIDPMAGMDIAEVKKLTYGKIALMGNVQCSYMQDGPIDKIKESANYAIDHGSKGGGYIFSTSNTIFKGIPLIHYEVMLDCLHKRFR